MSERKTYLVELQERATSKDAAGQPRELWISTRKEWASIQPIAGREYFAASGERATITHRIRVPYACGARARDRLLYNGTVYDIRSVLLRDRDLELMCVEVA